MSIAFPDRRPPAEVTAVEYVGGPWAGLRKEPGRGLADAIAVADRHGQGVYRRSVRCADDGILRYVWHA